MRTKIEVALAIVGIAFGAAFGAEVGSAPAGGNGATYGSTPAKNPFAPPPLSEECQEFCDLCAEEPQKGKKKSGMCERVEARCGCAAHAEAVKEAKRLLALKAAKDSTQRAEQARRDSVRKASVVEYVAEYLRGACRSDTCRLSFIVDKNPAPKPAAPAASQKDSSGNPAKAASTSAAPAKTPPIPNPFLPPPLSEDCTEFCGACDAQKKGKKDAMCERIEAKCGCAAHAAALIEADRLFAEQRAKDSVEQAERVKREQERRAAEILRSKDAAQRIFEFCEKETRTPLCSITVVLDRGQFGVVGLSLFVPPRPPAPAPAPAPQPAPAPAPQPTPPPAPTSAAATPDSVKQADTSKTVPKALRFAHEHKWLKPYIGVTFVLEGLREQSIAEGLPTYLEDVDSKKLVTGGFIVGVFKLSHLGSVFSFQRGVNFGCNVGAYDIDKRNVFNAKYQSYFLELPVELRVGYPGLGPFLSASVHLRKPIAADTRISGYSGYHYYDHYYDGWSGWEAYRISDWDLFLYFGAGLELSRHVALEFRGLWHSFATYKHLDENTQYGGQLSLDFAW